MKAILLLFFIFVTCQAMTWTEYKKTFQKSYKSSIDERKRFGIFTQNMEKIEEHNKRFEQGLETFKMGVNQFTDRTLEEMVRMNGLKPSFAKNHKITKLARSPEDIPEQIDWRDKDAVGPVSDQGSCGGSWIFSVIDALESLNKIKNGKFQNLSYQNLIDCAGTCKDGCGGSLLDSSFYDYVQKNGIESEQDYPTDFRCNNCSADPTKVVLKISEIGVIDSGDDEKLKEVVALNGPVSVGIEVGVGFITYASGIYKDASCTGQINHSLLIVGYGIEEGTEYWIAKNTWSGSWGENGYIRIDKNTANLCGVSRNAMYPIC